MHGLSLYVSCYFVYDSFILIYLPDIPSSLYPVMLMLYATRSSRFWIRRVHCQISILLDTLKHLRRLVICHHYAQSQICFLWHNQQKTYLWVRMLRNAEAGIQRYDANRCDPTVSRALSGRVVSLCNNESATRRQSSSVGLSLSMSVGPHHYGRLLPGQGPIRGRL